MLFQEATPDTSGYMIAGYAISFIVLAVYVASMYMRNRNLNQDMDMLAGLEQKPPAVKPKAIKKAAKPVTKKSKKK